MQAATLHAPAPIATQPLKLQEVSLPRVHADHVLLRVRACGVCRTDLHIVEGELAPKRHRLSPGIRSSVKFLE